MIKTDVLIVGQGLAGSILAWELDRLNINFIVMDAPGIPKSSSVAAGLFNPLMFRKLRISRMAANYWPVMQKFYRTLETKLDIKLLHDMPSFKMLNNEEVIEWNHAKAIDLSPYVGELESMDSIKGIKSYPAFGNIKESGYLDIALLMYETKKWLEEQNLLVSEALDYGSLHFDNNRILINDCIHARRIVFCEGAQVVNNPWFRDAGVSPNKGEIIEITAPGLENRFIIRNEVFVLPVGTDLFRVGATYSREYTDASPSSEALQELIVKLEDIIDVPYTIISQKAGIRPAIKDRMPLLGPHPEMPHLIIFNGLGSKGVAQAPFWAEKLANWLINGEKLPELVDVKRFFRQ
jgi:glycine oxidase